MNNMEDKKLEQVSGGVPVIGGPDGPTAAAAPGAGSECPRCHEYTLYYGPSVLVDEGNEYVVYESRVCSHCGYKVYIKA